jgi:hypothetical protein
MKKLVTALILVCVFMPVCAHAQTPTECNSISQKFGEAPYIEGDSAPANILMRMIDSESFLFEVNSNPGFTISFIQIVYTDSVGTHIINPGPNAIPPIDITTSWQTEIEGKFSYYKVSGCQAFQASTSTSTTYNTPPQTPLVLVCPAGEREVINVDGSQYCQADPQIKTPPYTPYVPVPVLVTPAFTG